MNAALKRAEECLAVRGLSIRTCETYLNHIRRFFEFSQQNPVELSGRDAEQYLLHVASAKNWSSSTRNQAASAIRFLIDVVLERPEAARRIPRAKTHQRLPASLSGSEVTALLDKMTSIVHRTLTLLCYGAGLRLKEACSLEISAIDPLRKVIHIRGGKGNKDRFVTLTPRLHQALRDYWKERRPKGPFLFPGATEGRHIDVTSFQKALTLASLRARIEKTVSPHVLRHSYATHMIEAGADLRSLQLLLGHASVTTTTRYVHLTQARLASLPSPLEMLGTKAGAIFG